MCYVIEDRVSVNGFHYAKLLEMSDADLAAAVAAADANQSFARVSWEYAHHWVLSDGLHETALFVDDMGRVRRSRS